jgi:predicted P-loop ATPase
MFVRCIACALDDSVFNKQAFVFVHSEQNSGKSTFCRWLCPRKLKMYYTEHFKPDKDSLIALTENFIINLDELATLSKFEINSLKSSFSTDKTKVRAPYDRKAIMKVRRANFIGSTNKDEFLSDETGSVRFLCFELNDRINFNYEIEMNIDDVWRQAYALYKCGFKYQLTPDEIIENEIANQKYQIETAEMQLIPEKFLPASKDTPESLFLNASEILKEVSIDNHFVKLTSQAIGKALKMLGFKQESKYNEKTGYTTKGYFVKKI